MNTLDPPKAKRRLLGTTLQKLRLHSDYHLSALVTSILGAPFWLFEQRRGRLQDRIDNKGDDK
jgi:hypothetical protein